MYGLLSYHECSWNQYVGPINGAIFSILILFVKAHVYFVKVLSKESKIRVWVCFSSVWHTLS